jgi:hypothetical protein
MIGDDAVDTLGSFPGDSWLRPRHHLGDVHNRVMLAAREVAAGPSAACQLANGTWRQHNGGWCSRTGPGGGVNTPDPGTGNARSALGSQPP